MPNGIFFVLFPAASAAVVFFILQSGASSQKKQPLPPWPLQHVWPCDMDDLHASSEKWLHSSIV